MSYWDEVAADAPNAVIRLDETSGTAAADAQGGTAGTYVGGFTLGQTTLIPSDTAGRSVLLNGSTGYIRFADRAAFDVGDRFTLEAWVNLTALPAAGTVASIIDKGSGAYILRVDPDGRLRLRRNGVAFICSATVLLRAGVTYHVVATKDGATTKLYVDGVDVTGTVTDSTMVHTAIELNIGSADAGGATSMLSGLVDGVAIYPTALGAARVTAHYNAGIATSGATIAHYDGTSWTDRQLHVYDGSAWRQAAGLGVL